MAAGCFFSLGFSGLHGGLTRFLHGAELPLFLGWLRPVCVGCGWILPSYALARNSLADWLFFVGSGALDGLVGCAEIGVAEDDVAASVALADGVDFGLVGYGVGADVVLFGVDVLGEFVEEFVYLFGVALVEVEGVLHGDGFFLDVAVDAT